MTKGDLIETFGLIYNGGPWYGKSITEGLDALRENGCKEEFELRQILAHMIAWRNYGIEHLGGNSDYEIKLNSEVDWPKETLGSFEDLERQLARNQEELILAIRNKEGEAWLGEKLGGKNFDFQFLLCGIVQHDLYHLGQLMLFSKLRKQL